MNDLGNWLAILQQDGTSASSRMTKAGGFATSRDTGRQPRPGEDAWNTLVVEDKSPATFDKFKPSDGINRGILPPAPSRPDRQD
jgi:hypothetical protein